MLDKKAVEKVEALLNAMFEGEEFTQDHIDGATYVLDALGYEVLDEYGGGYVVAKKEEE